MYVSEMEDKCRLNIIFKKIKLCPDNHHHITIISATVILILNIVCERVCHVCESATMATRL